MVLRMDLVHALDDLDARPWSSLSHAYGSAEAVPLLVGIAAAGHRTADVLALLGSMAASEDEYDVAPGAVRAAMADRLPSPLPLSGRGRAIVHRVRATE